MLFIRHFNFISLIICITCWVLAGCGASETPESGARAFMEAVAEMDGSKMLERACQAQQANLSASGTMAQAWISTLMIFGQGLGGAELKIDVSGLEYSTVNQNGDHATVRIHGVVRTNIGLAASEQPLDQTAPMLFEDGRWKMCG